MNARVCLAAIPLAAGLALGLGACGSSGPSQSYVQGQIVTWLHNNDIGAGSVSCNLPGSWTPGATFKCFVYRGSGKGLGVVNGTVLHNESGRTAWNESYNPLGG